MKFLYDIYFSIFNEEISEVRHILNLVRKVDPNFKLLENMRPIIDLANHIAQIPRIDYGIYSGELSTGKLAHSLELKLERDTVDEIIDVFDKGCTFLREQFASFDDEDFLEEKLVAFYEQDQTPKSWSFYLPKIITHLVLHKGILWTYLKACLDVDMFTYYGGKFDSE